MAGVPLLGPGPAPVAEGVRAPGAVRRPVEPRVIPQDAARQAPAGRAVRQRASSRASAADRSEGRRSTPGSGRQGLGVEANRRDRGGRRTPAGVSGRPRARAPRAGGVCAGSGSGSRPFFALRLGVPALPAVADPGRRVPGRRGRRHHGRLVPRSSASGACATRIGTSIEISLITALLGRLCSGSCIAYAAIRGGTAALDPLGVHDASRASPRTSPASRSPSRSSPRSASPASSRSS